ncbi:MAG: DUF11 domain-containing protein, partial [Gammaproteobacteria bacterium]|nr:DUF11 domain-containing protein [Gammaproteobacteria bacterium]
TRAIRYQESYYPSDIFLMKMSDSELVTELGLSVSVLNSGTIHEGDQIKYELVITNNSASVDAKSVRINMSFPFLASNETIKNYASIINAEKCEMEYKQIYCVIGDLSFSQSKTVNVTLQPRISGNFPVTFSLMSQTTDSDMSNNNLDINSWMKVVPDSGALGYWTIGLLLILMLVSILSSRYSLRTRQNY